MSRTDVRPHRRERLVLLVLALCLMAAILFSFPLGQYPISLKELCGILLSRLFPIEPYWTVQMETVLFNVRAPRILLSCLVGCALSAAGAAYQGVFQNPMASPDILGATKGSAFGVALALLLGVGTRVSILCGFAAGLVSLGLVWLVSAKAKGKRVVNLILAGIIVSALFDAGISYIKLVADPNDQLPVITYWLLGSLNATKPATLSFALPPILIGVVPLFLLRWQLGVLTLGDEEARSMGVNTGAVRGIVLLCASLLTAASVSVSGVVNWVGLVIPHLARKLVGANYRYLIPASMLLGALFLLVVDNISRNLFPTEIPLGILTAFVGAPFFLYLMMRGGDST